MGTLGGRRLGFVEPLAIRLGAPILLICLGIGMLVGQDGPGKYAFDDFSLNEQRFIARVVLRGAVPIFLAIIPVMGPGLSP